MLLSCHHNAGQYLYIKIATRYLKNVAQYLEMTVININFTQENIKRKLIMAILANIRLRTLSSWLMSLKRKHIHNHNFVYCFVWV
jgi:hypothetical protein